MKIIYDHQVFGWQQYGGVSRYFLEIANHIASTDRCGVEVFAPLYVNEYLRKGKAIRPRGMWVPALPRCVPAVTWINNKISALGLSHRDDVNIFHETYYTQADYCPRSAKRIVTVHDMIHEKFPDDFEPYNNTTRLKSLAVERADHVICVSENTRLDLLELYNIPEDKTSVVYHGYSLTVAQPKEVSHENSTPYMMYVGNRNGYKNAERLLRAYAGSATLKDNFKLIFFGGGRFSVKERDLLRRLSLSNDDVLQISGGDDVLAGLYAGAAALVCPSLYEGFGIPPLEAMAHNCPVICSNVSSLPEVVGDAAEFFNPNDEESILQALETVVLSQERRADLVEKGHRRCQRFSWEKCANDTLAVYEKVLHR